MALPFGKRGNVREAEGNPYMKKKRAGKKDAIVKPLQSVAPSVVLEEPMTLEEVEALTFGDRMTREEKLARLPEPRRSHRTPH